MVLILYHSHTDTLEIKPKTRKCGDARGKESNYESIQQKKEKGILIKEMEFQGCCHLRRTISLEPRKLSLAVSFALRITLRLVSYFHFKTASIEYLAFPGTLLWYCHPFCQQLQIAKVSEILRQFACENRDHCRKALFSYRWVGLHRQCLSPIAKMERNR